MSIIDIKEHKERKDYWKLSTIIKKMLADPRKGFLLTQRIAQGTPEMYAISTLREVGAFQLGVLQGIASMQVNKDFFGDRAFQVILETILSELPKEKNMARIRLRRFQRS